MSHSYALCFWFSDHERTPLMQASVSELEPRIAVVLTFLSLQTPERIAAKQLAKQWQAGDGQQHELLAPCTRGEFPEVSYRYVICFLVLCWHFTVITPERAEQCAQIILDYSTDFQDLKDVLSVSHKYPQWLRPCIVFLVAAVSTIFFPPSTDIHVPPSHYVSKYNSESLH